MGNPADSIDEIKQMANEFDSDLKHRWPATPPYQGGLLLLGRYYAESRRIYFGLNPGGDGEDFEYGPNLGTAINPPFDFPGKRDRYCTNWRKFLGDNIDLRNWFNDRVTSTFLVPWRTPHGADLRRMNVFGNGLLFDLSGRLVQKMIDHHDAEVLIVAGKSSLYLLNELLKLSWTRGDVETPFGGAKGAYQWRRREAHCGRPLTILQIPHFSRASSPGKLGPFAHWLRRELKPFGL